MTRSPTFHPTLLILAILMGSLAGCASVSNRVRVYRPLEAKKKIVVAQLVCRWGDRVGGHTVRMNEQDLLESIERQGIKLVKELRLATDYEVVPFSIPPAGLAQRACTDAFLCPEGWASWTGPATDADVGELTPEAAEAIAKAHQADGVLVVYVFWELVPGWSKTALAKTRFWLYAPDGSRLAEGMTGGKAGAGVFPAGREATRAFTEATGRSFHELAIRLQKSE
jgi:hypothetical protein